MLNVDISRQGRVRKADFERVAAVTICFQKHDNVEDFIPFELLPSVCILNLKDCSLTAPGYTGSLLADVNDRIRAVPTNGPVFSIIYSILCDIERTVQWWKMVTSPSVDSSAARSAILSKGFSRMDTQIIKNLSNLAER
ncbi:uncharacterized protein LOC129224997 [Uloborus diversus]|uniref:uncharacterized protein LOC129224997 n=1 Tax=Uloborus diversus TaxID=327109 RepID=UPI00240A4B9D|nr:uncharacterized protein LOC129224997 [Uloborus diversus]